MPVPPKSVIQQAKKGLDWRRDYGRGGTPIVVARALDLVNGADISSALMERMSNYFARHQHDALAEGWNEGDAGFPSAGRVAWQLLGGDAGRQWVEGLQKNENMFISSRLLSEIMVAPAPSIKRPELDALERDLRASLRSFGLDVVFTDHFFQRLSHTRNSPPLKLEEIRSLFMQLIERKKMRGRLKSENDGYEAVLFEKKSLINIPFKLLFDKRSQVHRIVPLTIMRTKVFKTSGNVLRIEGVDQFLRPAFTDGLVVLYEHQFQLLREAVETPKTVSLMQFLSKVSKATGQDRHIYVVGGAVRDFVLGKIAKDIDIVIDSVGTGGKDSEWFARILMQEIPAKTKLVTNNYGVAILSVVGDWSLDGHTMKGETIEIANAREESYGGAGGKGYKPSDVRVADIAKDVLRREFTFNTLMWRMSDLASGPDKAEIIDLTGCGLSDLKSGRMSCPSNPEKVFSDDPSRILRAVKFLLRYSWFKLSPEVESAIRSQGNKLLDIPPEAVVKILTHDIFLKGAEDKALQILKKLNLIEWIDSIAQSSTTFRTTLMNFARGVSIRFWLDLINAGISIDPPLKFLSRDERKAYTSAIEKIDDAQHTLFTASLEQPGIAIKDKDFIPSLSSELGIAIKSLAPRVTAIARKAILDDPRLINSPTRLKDLILSSLK